MAHVSVEALERAVVQLGCSDKGQQAMQDLLAFLENGGISLDADNQQHILHLLSGAWGSYAGTTLEALRGAANLQDDLVAAESPAA